MKRRKLLAGAGAGGGLGLGLTAAMLTPTSAAHAADEPRPYSEVVLLGYNPGVRLVDRAGSTTAFVSVWGVDWSIGGYGQSITAVYDGKVRVLGPDPDFGCWLADYFVRAFPEVEGLPWPEPEAERTAVEVDLDLSKGLVARAGDLVVHAGDVLARRPVNVEGFEVGGGVPHALTMALAPCGKGSIRVRGRRLPGEVVVGGTPERPSSSAFLSHSETWRR